MCQAPVYRSTFRASFFTSALSPGKTLPRVFIDHSQHPDLLPIMKPIGNKVMEGKTSELISFLIVL